MPGKVPGRLVLAGTITGVVILGAIIAVIFLVVPWFESRGTGSGIGHEGPALDAGIVPDLSLDHARWKGELRADAVLLAVVVAMVVAGSRQRPTAALLRTHDALLLLSPGPPVLECIATSVEAARRYWATPRAVSAVQLARYVEPVLRALPGVRTPARQMAPELPVD